MLYNISTCYITDGKIFEKRKFNGQKKSFLPSLELPSETFLILNRIEQDTIINPYPANVEYRVSS